MRRYLTVILSLAIVLLLKTSCFAENHESLFGYVACNDKRIYLINIDSGKVVYKSDSIMGLGRPTSIDLDNKGGKLYVASERGRWQSKYSPIVVFSVKTMQVEVIKKIDLIKEDSSGNFRDISGVYNIVVSPNTKHLYIGYSHPEYADGTTVIDSETGKIIKKINVIIDKGSIFSPDGRKVAEIWPGGRKVYIRNKKEYVKDWSGGVAIYDLEKNIKVSHKELVKDRIGLNPEWGNLKQPFIYFRNYRLVEVYNRNNGQVINKINIQEITGGLNTEMKYPVLLDNGKKIILSMADSNNQGYIAIIDLIEKKVLKKIKVGDGPSNVVVGYKIDGK